MMWRGASLDLSAWRSRAPLWLGVAVIVALSWLTLARMNAGMTDGGMSHGAMAHDTVMMDVAERRLTSGFVRDLIPAFAMWSVMMFAMMLPSVAPAIATYDALAQRRKPEADAGLPTCLFVAGYAAAWIGFSALAAVGQVIMAHASLLTPMLRSTNTVLSVAVLATAGLFQFTGLKNACLTHCRTPLAFFMAEWRDGTAGAFLLGLHHGRYCVGCCWALMAVMFVLGAMDLAYMAALAAFILVEKLAPESWPVTRVSGVGLMLWAGSIAIETWI